jgi:hypothetical protein
MVIDHHPPTRVAALPHLDDPLPRKNHVHPETITLGSAGFPVTFEVFGCFGRAY